MKAAVAFVAKSGTGKTTLLEKTIAELKKRGRRVGALKNAAHGFDIDHPGKDSHRMTVAGADTVLLASPDKIAMVMKTGTPLALDELLRAYFSDVDVVLVEGFKKSGLQRIEVHRKAAGAELICRGEEYDTRLLAVASDEPLELDVPVLDLNDPCAVADFIEAKFLES